MSISNFEQVRDSQEFADFLNGHTETHSGKTLAALADEADLRQDAYLVSTFYQAFKDFQTPAKPDAPPTPNNSKEAYIAPDASSSAKTPQTTSKAKRIFTGADIAKHHHDYQQGVYNGRAEEWRVLEKEMNAAIGAGEVLP